MAIQKILIVDDSPTERYFLTEVLVRNGFSVSTAENGEEALTKIKADKPQLILMDVVMPGQNGFQITRAIAKDPETQDVPIIICTSKNQETDRIWGLRQGAKDYLVKPIDPQELLAKIAALSQRSADSLLASIYKKYPDSLMTKTLSDSAANLEITKSDSGVRRTRLREFQAQLVERMQAAQRGGFSKLSQLGIIIGQQRYLLDLREAGEIVSATLLTNVPLTKDWYVGLSNIRGNLTSVVDLSRFQGFELTKLDNSCRIVGFAPSLGFNSGLLVSQVLGLRNLAEMEEIASGETDGNSQEWLQRRFRDRDGNVWHELSLAALVQNQDFLHIGLQSVLHLKQR